MTSGFVSMRRFALPTFEAASSSGSGYGTTTPPPSLTVRGPPGPTTGPAGTAGPAGFTVTGAWSTCGMRSLRVDLRTNGLQLSVLAGAGVRARCLSADQTGAVTVGAAISLFSGA